MSTGAAPGNWVELWRIRLPEGTRRRRYYDTFFLPVYEPIEFTETHEELVRQLRPPTGTGAEERSKEILEEAQKAFAEAEARGEGAERRATTLQGAVAIATSVLLAGGALLSDPTKIHGGAWRVCLAIALFAVTGCLVMSGARALAATARIHVYHRPTPSAVLQRSQMDAVEARIELAAETLKDFGSNDQVAAWKIAYLGAAAWWFRGALASLLLLAALLAAYLAFATAPASSAAASEAWAVSDCWHDGSANAHSAHAPDRRLRSASPREKRRAQKSWKSVERRVTQTRDLRRSRPPSPRSPATWDRGPRWPAARRRCGGHLSSSSPRAADSPAGASLDPSHNPPY